MAPVTIFHTPSTTLRPSEPFGRGLRRCKLAAGVSKPASPLDLSGSGRRYSFLRGVLFGSSKAPSLSLSGFVGTSRHVYRCSRGASLTSPYRHFIPMLRTTASSVPHVVGPCVGSWLRGCRSRVDRSGPLAPFVPTPPSQSHPEPSRFTGRAVKIAPHLLAFPAPI